MKSIKCISFQLTCFLFYLMIINIAPQQSCNYDEHIERSIEPQRIKGKICNSADDSDQQANEISINCSMSPFPIATDQHTKSTNYFEEGDWSEKRARTSVSQICQKQEKLFYSQIPLKGTWR